jgi:chitin disaccharide deacetylase
MHIGDGKTTDSAGMRVVFHADDLGLNRAVSDGIFCGFARGLLTSTSVLANATDAPRTLKQWKQLLGDWSTGQMPSAAARRVLDDPQRPFDLGVHLNLTQGRPLTADGYPPQLLDENGCFPSVHVLFRRLHGLSADMRGAIQRELSQQVHLVLDHGLQPTHLNGHQYIEMLPAISAMVAELLDRLHIKVIRVALERPVLATALKTGVSLPELLLGQVKQYYARRFRRRMDRLGAVSPDAFCGTLHAGRIDMRVLRLFLRQPSRCRLVEIAMHPAEALTAGASDAEADGWHDPLWRLRPLELETLLSRELVEFLQAKRVRLGRLAQSVDTDGE